MAMKPEPQQTEVTNCVCGHRYEQHASRDYSAYCHTACGCTKYARAEQPEQPLLPHSATLGKMVMLLLQRDFEAARELALETPLEFPDGSPRAAAPVVGEQEYRRGIQRVLEELPVACGCTCKPPMTDFHYDCCPIAITNTIRALAEQPLPAAPQADRDIQIPPPGHVKLTKQGRAYVEADHLTDLEVPPAPQHLFDAKLLGFGDADRVRLCESCLNRAIGDDLVVHSSGVPVFSAAAPPVGEQEICGRTYRDRWCQGCKMNHRYYTGWANEGR